MTMCLPQDVWDRILSELRGDAVNGHQEFFKVLTISRAWANIALPHLYRHIHMRIRLETASHINALRSLSSAMLMIGSKYPKNTWIKPLLLDIDEAPAVGDGWCRSANVFVLSNWLTVIFMHSRLRTFALTGFGGAGIQSSAMVALAQRSHDTLTTLHVEIDAFNLEIIHIISQMGRLHTLHLCFKSSQIGQQPIMPHLAGLPPLSLSSMRDFAFEWHYLQHNGVYQEVVPYLSTCTFDPTCRLTLDFHIGFEENVAVGLNPFFLRHRCEYVNLVIPGIYDSRAVLMTSQMVQFEYLPDPDIFKDIPHLPSRVIFCIIATDDDEQLERLWMILKVLAESNQTFNSSIQVDASIEWEGYTAPVAFKWDTVPELRAREELVMTIRLMQFSLTLAPKGLILLDSVGAPMNFGHSIT